MTLSSFSFMLFLLAVLAVMAVLQLLRKRVSFAGKSQIIILLLFSYFFILKTDYRFCICVGAVALVSYWFGLWIEKTHNPKILTGGVSP
jgi:D-alanyl-lipoteichoic acid acyltransferase DltB (MBOAT superfamily)